MPRGLTAEDVIRFEREELGNQDITVEEGIDPKSIKAENLTWVTTRPENAAEYGEVEEVIVGNYRIVAQDSDGGLLIESD